MAIIDNLVYIPHSLFFNFSKKNIGTVNCDANGGDGLVVVLEGMHIAYLGNI